MLNLGRMHLLAVFTLLVLAGFQAVLAAQESALNSGLRKDAEALRSFRSGIMRDPSGAFRDWEAQSNPCRWNGVECARVDGMDRVVSLELWGLELEGSISSQVGQLSELRKLAIVGNKLKGGVPFEIRNCHKITHLDLRANHLSGTISFSLADLPLLETLKLSENQLTGTLSALLYDTKGYSSFDPFHFFGTQYSSKAGLCPQLRILDLAQNSLSGKISSAIGECGRLVELSLNDNKLSGPIPSTLSAIPHLRSLLLNRNRLDGPLPAPLAIGCKNLQYLDVSDNLLSGTIPSEFSAYRGARHFNFANNQLVGPIPLGRWKVEQMAMEGFFSSNPGLCGWPLTEVCDTTERESSSKDLELQTPGSLFYKGWRYFADLYSRLHKKVQTLGQQIGKVSVRGRFGLKSKAGTRRSMAESGSPAASPVGSLGASPAPTPSASPSKKSRHTARRWALGLALGLVAGAIAAAILAVLLRLCVFYMHKAPYLSGPIIFHPNISPKMLLFLERDGSLREAELVGEGGAGRVYKAELENDMVVAVKSVLVKEDQKGLFGKKQIQAELETLGCIRHRNLVVLLAYVHRPNCHLLLYEYMRNGSLHHAFQKVNAGELELPWPVRHRIAVGTCEGLSYLHFLSNPRIVHRDLKPSNILLDDNFVAHVSDFGLAKVIPGADTHVTTGVAGTVGYIAPEYSQTCRFTDKSDVYSFGVVLAVLLTGKDPTDQFFHTVPGGSIGSWLHDLLQKGEGADAIDPRLKTGEEHYEEEMLLAMKIAVFCTSANPNERPSSKEVLVMLGQIRQEEGP
ncbi:unnamed protein product [Calypogeia fissa]